MAAFQHSQATSTLSRLRQPTSDRECKVNEVPRPLQYPEPVQGPETPAVLRPLQYSVPVLGHPRGPPSPGWEVAKDTYILWQPAPLPPGATWCSSGAMTSQALSKDRTERLMWVHLCPFQILHDATSAAPWGPFAWCALKPGSSWGPFAWCGLEPVGVLGALVLLHPIFLLLLLLEVALRGSRASIESNLLSDASMPGCHGSPWRICNTGLAGCYGTPWRICTTRLAWVSRVAVDDLQHPSGRV